VGCNGAAQRFRAVAGSGSSCTRIPGDADWTLRANQLSRPV